MKKYRFTIRGYNYEVDVISFENNIVELEVNGTPYNVEVQLQRNLPEAKTPKLVRSALPKPKPEEATIAKKAAGSGQTTIRTPLPGTVLHIKVSPGDTVKQGDILLIMEAMKMENNVTAPRDGAVLEVKVSEGESVLQDAALMILE